MMTRATPRFYGAMLRIPFLFVAIAEASVGMGPGLARTVRCRHAESRSRPDQADRRGIAWSRRVMFRGALASGTGLGIRLSEAAQTTENNKEDVERFLDLIYSYKPKAGYTTEAKDASLAFRTYDKLSSIGFNPLTGYPPPCTGGTYGEITRDGVEKLAKILQLDRKPTASFWDLGSGAGKMVLHMRAAGYASKSQGVEFSQSRSDAATELQRAVAAQTNSLPLKKALEDDVKLFQGDLRQRDFSDATVIWTANLCFPASVSAALGEKILESKTIEAVAALDEIPGLEKAFELSEITLPQTWDSMDVYLYSRRIQDS